MFSIHRRRPSFRAATTSNARHAVSARRSVIESLESRVMLAAQIYVTDDAGTVIGKYDDNGNAINNLLLTGLAGGTYVYPAVSGQYLFISNFGTGTIGEYTTSGQTINASLVTGLSAGGVSSFGLTVSGNQIFVANGDGGSPGSSGTVGEYTLGATPGTIVSSNPSLITGLADPDAVVVSGSDLFVSDYANANIGEYTTSGGTVNVNLVTGLQHPESLAISGSDLFVTNYDASSIGEYTTSGQTVNTALVTNLEGPCGIAAAGNELFVVNASAGSVGEYSTSGAAINTSLIGGLGGTLSITAVPDAGTVFAQEPTNALPGTLISPLVVDINDDQGQIDTTDNGNVTLSITSSGTSGATLGGTTTVAATNGVATFNNISIDQPGYYTLTATDTALDSVISTPFHVGTTSALVPTFGRVSLASTNVAGQKLNAKVPVVITNQGSNFKGNYTVNIFADTIPSLDGNQVPITSLTKKNVALKSNKGQPLNFNVKSLPSTLPDGTYYLLAEVVDSTGATNMMATTQTVQVAAPFITPAVIVAAVAPASIALNKTSSILITVTNDGNVAATGVVIALSPSADSVSPVTGVTLATFRSVGVKILPNKSKTFRLHFKVTNTLAAGSYQPYVAVSLSGISTTVVGSMSFTVG
jgi:hypothetical protein